VGDFSVANLISPTRAAQLANTLALCWNWPVQELHDTLSFG